MYIFFAKHSKIIFSAQNNKFVDFAPKKQNLRVWGGDFAPQRCVPWQTQEVELLFMPDAAPPSTIKIQRCSSKSSGDIAKLVIG